MGVTSMQQQKLVSLLALALFHAACQAQPQKVRPAANAGSFYPAGPKELSGMIDGLLAKAKVPDIKDVVAVVSPHAGYIYSGGVAAHSYALLKGRKIERVVVIAPSHLEAFPFSAVYDGAAYATPLGQVPVDTAFAAALAKSSKLIQISGRGHDPAGGRAEHAVEVQIPFLQRVLGQFKLVPIVMGDQDYELCRALGLALAKNIKGPETIIVASSDLSHYHPYDDAVKMDRKTLRAIEEWDYLSLLRNLEQHVWEACGGGPIVAAMIASERLGAKQARLLTYANSGDSTGDHSQVVGYGAVAICKNSGPRAAAEQPFTLGPAEKRELFRIARSSVESVVNRHKILDDPPLKLEVLAQERGAFVTLREKGELRGCIGYTSPIKPLALTVRDVAAYAAVEDTRFQPVSPKELPLLEYEISVLSPLRRVLDVREIQVGTHGLVMKQGRREGLLLPQVPVEQGWNRETFLAQTCVKAGMLADCWKDDRTDIFSFTALVIEEHEGTQAAAKPGTPH
jgi:AmmeMemoRadiSam system protein B/AmmeMemoRadiSam system protein A